MSNNHPTNPNPTRGYFDRVLDVVSFFIFAIFPPPILSLLYWFSPEIRAQNLAEKQKALALAVEKETARKKEQAFVVHRNTVIDAPLPQWIDILTAINDDATIILPDGKVGKKFREKILLAPLTQVIRIDIKKEELHATRPFFVKALITLEHLAQEKTISADYERKLIEMVEALIAALTPTYTNYDQIVTLVTTHCPTLYNQIKKEN